LHARLVHPQDDRPEWLQRASAKDLTGRVHA
jgi:hypothetical protein